MATKPNELVSPVVPPLQQREAMEALPDALACIVGNEILRATYGHGCHLHPELCYIPVRVGTSWLARFIHDSLHQRIVVPGESDFILVVRDGELEIEFCHEGHIHVSGTNHDLIAKLLAIPVFNVAGSGAKS